MTAGVITNDQGNGLIDTALGQRYTARVREVTGGCFCCQAADLGIALRELAEEGASGLPPGSADQIARDAGGDEGHSRRAGLSSVIIAEPVGSCTDLIATVILPMERIFGQPLDMAPMSVVIDGARIEAAMKDERSKNPGGKRSGFTADVRYIFEKQLEEAELLVLNKSELLTAKRLATVAKWLKEKHPGKRVITVSATTGAGLDAWFALLLSERSQPKTVMEMDYERYGMGEARLGWYNATLGLHSTGRPFDGNRLLVALANDIQADLEAAGAELAHLKMSLGRAVQSSEGRRPTAKNSQSKATVAEPMQGEAQLRLKNFAVVNAVRNGVAATLSCRSAEKFVVAELMVNLRAEAEPEVLDRVVLKHLCKTRTEWHAVWKHRAAFKPGQPQPTYRFTNL